MKQLIIAIELKKEERVSKLLSHAEYQTFKDLAKGHKFTIIPKGRIGVEVVADVSLWEQLGY